jgi:hypothetical protein
MERSLRQTMIAGLTVVVTASGCASMQEPSTGTPAPATSTAAPPAAAPSAGQTPPAAAPSAGQTPGEAPPAAAPSAAAPPPSVTPAPSQSKAKSPPDTHDAKQASVAPAPPRPAVASPPSSPPAKAAATAAAPPAAPAQPTLNLADLEQRLRETHAIGVFTKLSLKNQVDDLLKSFRDLYRDPNKRPPAELRQRYDLLLLKVLALLQDGDPPLASAIASSREAIWSILADPNKFASI